MDSSDDSAHEDEPQEDHEDESQEEPFVPIHPKASPTSYAFKRKVTRYWSKREEDELINGVLFLLKKFQVRNARAYVDFLKEVATYLTFTLRDKANVKVIARKMRHLTDICRHYKIFLFMSPGLSYNPHTGETKFGPKYWRSFEKESVLDAYFRTFGFRHYERCCRIFQCYKLEQYASYIDEAVYATIPVGIALTGPDAFFYPLHRARTPQPKKNEIVNCNRESGWTLADFDELFFCNGWYPYNDWEFIEHFVEVFDKFEINTKLCFYLRVSEISIRYNHPDDDNITYNGILDKIRSIAYVYQLFKRFVFNTVGVEYNFMRHSTRVNDDYWNHEGKEPLYMYMFRMEGFPFYERCYHVFEERGVEKYVNDDLPPVDPNIPKGVKMTDVRDVFKSYYQAG